ncbi:MAG: GAF domain-containing protein [Ignavibacteriae bacterium]|nr:GAF domain-containing protein [Ignavibacteriota bacterium]
MNKRKINIKKVLIPSDSIAIVVILIGLLIALFLSELAIRLIGISIMILGSVALFMLISQRMSEIVESNKFKASTPAPNYHITIKKDTAAKRQTIENFEATFSPEEQKMRETSDTQRPTQPVIEEYMTQEEGFRIIRKTESGEGEQSPDERQVIEEINYKLPEIEKPQIKLDSGYEFEEEMSGLKIIGKKEQRISEEILSKKEPELFDTEPKKIPIAEIPDERNEAKSTSKLIEDLKEHISKTIKEPDSKTLGIKPIYDIQDNKEKYKEKHLDIPISELIENEPVFGQEPRKEFQYFLSKALTIIRSVTITRTATFIMVNTDKGELILEAFVSDFPPAITKKLKFPIGNDIVSQIVKNLKPEILTEINPAAELDLIPYYRQAVGTSSFIGVPVFYDGSIIGIICADSDVADSYDANTVGFLGHFTKLIGSLIHSYIEKHDLKQNSRTLQAINKFRSISANRNATVDDIIESVVDAATGVFEFSNMGICSFDESLNKWTIKSYRTKDAEADNIQGTIINIQSSLVGRSMSSNKTVFITPVDESVIRFNPDESRTAKGYFVSVPLKTFTNNYGALFVEGINPSSMTSYDVNVLETLGEHAGAALEQIQFYKVLQFSSLIDISTGLYNPPALYQRLEEEFFRSKEIKSKFTFCLIHFDKYASFDPEKYQDRAELVIEHITKVIHKHIRSFDIFGRVDSTTLGIVLIGSNLNESKIWAEKVRSEIATSEFKIENKRFNVTVSMGISESAKADNVEDLISNTRKVLEISIGKTNCVSVYT